MDKIWMTILALSIAITCNSQSVEIYYGELKGDIKTIRTSIIELRPNNKFKLTKTIGYLDQFTHSKRIYEISGEMNRTKNKLILLGKKERRGDVKYEAHKGDVHVRGTRGSGFLATDTMYSTERFMSVIDTMIFFVFNRTSAKYLSNKDNCFIHYKTYSTSIDWFNECEKIEFLLQLKSRMFSMEQNQSKLCIDPRKSILKFDLDSIYIVDFPFLQAGVLSIHVGSYGLNYDSLKINCSINKSIYISMNTGQVISYSDHCQDQLSLEISNDLNILRMGNKEAMKYKHVNEHPHETFKWPFEIDKDWQDIHPYDWVFKFKDYDDTEKKMKCKN